MEFDIESFRKELKALLEKYDCHIYGSYYGDTHGIHADSLSVCGNARNSGPDYLLSSGQGQNVSASDIDLDKPAEIDEGDE